MEGKESSRRGGNTVQENNPHFGLLFFTINSNLSSSLQQKNETIAQVKPHTAETLINLSVFGCEALNLTKINKF